MSIQNNPLHQSVACEIESGLKLEYENVPQLTDALCMIGLDNAIVAVKQ
ncbi:hypothetical protein LQ564_21720 [Massilia sp. G4R7]|uniref:Uncharacterized protein n=1 Tax=Massilia phyllostachyos TaxID=2898585 RepID=A0ABS8QAZ7_9BURK|nr:hypothetical protein [Massilia phyllostachyos]MCD2518922.1 hypothetical protein [Massilia phyllostachyos]